MNARLAPHLMLALLAIAPLAAMAAPSDMPLSATLLPEVRVTASVSHPHAAPILHVADTAPQRVTLLPTLRVEARVDAPVLLPVVRVAAQRQPLLPIDAIASQMPMHGWHDVLASLLSSPRMP